MMRMFKKEKIFLWLLVNLSFVANAQRDTLTLSQAIAATMEYNYDVQLLRNDSAVFALNERFADAAFLPRVNATAAWVKNNNNQKQKLADGSERKQNNVKSSNIQSSLNLNWTLFDGFKMFATRQKVSEFIKLGDLNIQNQMLQSVAEVTKKYYEIVRQKQQLKAIEEQMGLNEERVKIADKKLSVGLGAKPEKLQAVLDLNAQKAARIKQLAFIEELKEQLNLLIAFKQGTAYEVTDSIPLNKNLVLGDAFENASLNNPALQITRQQVTLAELTLKEKNAARYPILNFNSAYNFSKTNNQTVLNTFTPLFNRNAGFNYGLSLNIPILNGFNARREIAVAKLDIGYQNLLLDFQQAQITSGISIAYKNYILQKETLALEESNILLAKENVYISSERLRLGITTAIELREAQRSLEEAYNRLIAARYNAKIAEIDVLLLEGNKLELY